MCSLSKLRFETEVEVFLMEYFFFIEPFLESIPQSHVLFVISLQSLSLRKIDHNRGVLHGAVDPLDPFFLATFFSSILSASFGVSNLLKLGPCPLIPQNKFGCVFFMVFFSILCGLIAKGIMIAFIVADKRFACLALLFCFSYLLPMLFVSTKYLTSKDKKRHKVQATKNGTQSKIGH